ncbi:hypothetical protein ACWDCO_30595 [Streptomyces albogriseolus]
MLRTLLRALRPTLLRIPARRFTAGIAALPPTAREAFGIDATAPDAIAYKRSGHLLPMPDDRLDDAVRALDFPYSAPSPETRAAIRAALAVLEADYTVTVAH